MNAFKITTEKGASWVTSFNGTLQDAKNYFVGTYFNVGQYPKEDMQKATEVVQL